MSPRKDRGLVNDGVMITGSGNETNIIGNAIGERASVTNTGPEATALRLGPRWDIGVITVLSEETRAVVDRLRQWRDCREFLDASGLHCVEARSGSGSGACRLVLLQALSRGTLSAAQAFTNLSRKYDPRVVVLTGIGGGIHADVALGDVVIGQEVIYYDRRKETVDGLRRRASSQPVSRSVRAALNRFFTDNGEPAQLGNADPDGATRTFNVMRGPIGSGEAVVADENSEIRKYLQMVNDQTLAVETEGAGLSTASYEETSGQAGHRPWLIIRGISDHADSAKNDNYHDIASWHAATVLEVLCPYLMRLHEAESTGQ